MSLIAVLAVAVTVVAAVRGTWSPCGMSMLSTLTPFAERNRGHRYWATASWFVIGGACGGACLGLLAAALALVVAWASPSGNVTVSVAALAALLTIASDLRLTPVRLAGHPRQVDENWVNQLRPWVYASGFGWQIGTGFATYVMTAGTYLMVVLDALTGRFVPALLMGVLFGTIRGLSLLAGSRQHSPAAARRFHARFEAMREWSWRLAIAAQLTVVVAALAAASSTISRAVIAVPAAMTLCRWASRHVGLVRRRRTTAPVATAS